MKGMKWLKQRVTLIDSLRGFSLFGILIANLLIFQYGMFGKENMEFFDVSPLDRWAYIGTKIFVESSFLPIFMFLFGYSLILLKEKLENRDKKVKRHLVRRFLLLVLFGLLHSFFVWEGDILLAYGLFGFIMLLFLNRKKKTVLYWGIFFFVATSLLSFGQIEETEEELMHQHAYVEKEMEAYSKGSYIEVFQFRMSDEDPYGYDGWVYLFIIILAPFITIPMFLFGVYAAKSKWFTRPDEEKGLYRRFAFLFLPLGVLLKSMLFLFPDHFLSSGSYTFGATFLAIGYIFAFALLHTTVKHNVFTALEMAGRLSLTNYLLQSVICTTIFYGYGLGLYGKLGVLNGIVLGIGIFALQAAISYFYLKRWKMGPFEKVIRIGTYLTWKGAPKAKIAPAERGQISNPQTGPNEAV